MLEIDNKILCVVVTYNRLSLLKKCIESLRKQTYHSFDILVVNNDSTDGTKEWLAEQNNLIVINQANLGGAGGFYTGTKWGYDKGYDWMWLMDDDGKPEKKQLMNLLKGADRLNAFFLNALVCNVDDNRRLSFGIDYDGKSIRTVAVAQKYEEIPNYINPFNGTLIHRKVMKDIGFIKKEMFIWGDEFDYYFRAKNAGYMMYTITDAIHYHPAGRINYVNMIPFVNRYRVEVPNGKRRHIKFRNMGYLHSRYYNKREKVKTMLMMTTYFLLRFNIFGLISFCRSYSQGERGIFK